MCCSAGWSQDLLICTKESTACRRNTLVYTSAYINMNHKNLFYFKSSWLQIPAPGWAELHVEVSLSKILNPKSLLMCGWHPAWRPQPSAKGPAMSWRLVQGIPCPHPEIAGIGSSKKKTLQPHKRDKAVTDNGWIIPVPLSVVLIHICTVSPAGSWSSFVGLIVAWELAVATASLSSSKNGWSERLFFTALVFI